MKTTSEFWLSETYSLVLGGIDCKMRDRFVSNWFNFLLQFWSFFYHVSTKYIYRINLHQIAIKIFLLPILNEQNIFVQACFALFCNNGRASLSFKYTGLVAAFRPVYALR